MMKPFKVREAYAVETGDYIGQVFIVIDISNKGDGHVCCLALPNMENVDVPRETFISGRNSGIITLLEQLPKSVFKVSEAQYYKNKDTAKIDDKSREEGCKV